MTKGRGNLAIHPFIALDERLARGRGMTDCELVGISGSCGPDCPVLKAGHCECQDEMGEDKEELPEEKDKEPRSGSTPGAR